MEVKVTVPIVLHIADNELIRDLRSDIMFLLSKMAEDCNGIETNEGWIEAIEYNQFKIKSLKNED